MLIDFGKATCKENGRLYDLSEPEKVNYLVKYPHTAPEVVHGEGQQNTLSNSIGRVFNHVADHGHFESLPMETKAGLLAVFNICRSIRISKRPSAKKCLEMLIKFTSN